MFNTYCFSTATAEARTLRNIKLYVRIYWICRVWAPTVQLRPLLGLSIDYRLKRSRFVMPFNAGIASLKAVAKGETTRIENFTRNN
jgi:hypothetical protein